MKNILIFWLVIGVIGCQNNGPTIPVLFGVQSLDSIKMEGYYTYEAQLSEKGHGGDIKRNMDLAFTVISSKDKSDNTLFIIPKRLQMSQDFPGSGKQKIDTDQTDSSVGYAATLTLQRFKPLLQSKYKLIIDSLGFIKSNDFNTALRGSGISDLSAFLENHPLHIGLDDGKWYVGKTWENDVVFTEAGVKMKGNAVFTIDSCGPTICYLTAVKQISPPEKHQDYQLEGKIKITGKLSVNRMNGWVASQHWQENINLRVIKGEENIPVIVKRECGYRTLP